PLFEVLTGVRRHGAGSLRASWTAIPAGDRHRHFASLNLLDFSPGNGARSAASAVSGRKPVSRRPAMQTSQFDATP
ncbi:MAG: hypothetical protein OSA97_11610, partial [Nevskia sp.]|nr:hypothetical protein [Nevskia sp.]